MDINLPLSPPVNNNIQISLNDRLDAVMFEKIRVANTQLDTRLSLQEKIINKYRRDAEKVHAHQTQRIRREVKKIRQKKPDYVFDDSDVSTSKSRFTTETGRQRCLSEPSNLSYCRRYYSHHYNVKDTSREDKKEKEGKRGKENDFFNMKLRLYFLNMMNNAYEKTHLEHDTPDEYKKSSNDTELFPSFDQSRHNHFFVRNISTDEEHDDVFANSLTSFKSIQQSNVSEIGNASTESKIIDINEEDKNAFQEHENNGKENMTGYGKSASRNTVILPDCVANMSYDGQRGQRRTRGRKAKRRSVIGSGSEAEVEFNEAERRKSKHAFEKIFAGLL